MMAGLTMRGAIAALACLLAAAPAALHGAGAAQADQAALEEFAALVDGSFETAPDDPDNSIASHWTRIPGAAFPGIAFYGQLNTGADRKLYRQRVYVYTTRPDGSILAASQGLRDPGRFVDAWTKPGLLRTLSPADLAPALDLAPGANCDMVWRRTGERTWSGRIAPEQCRLWSARRNQAIGLEAESEIGPDRMRQTERGYDAAGKQLFGTSPGTFISLFRRQ